jgi:hypothetical protein
MGESHWPIIVFLSLVRHIGEKSYPDLQVTRHCDNKGETINYSSVRVSKRERLAMLADPRTISLVTREEKVESLKFYKELYVDYAKTAVDWERKAVEDEVVVVEEPQQKKQKSIQRPTTVFDSDDDDDDDDEGAGASKSAAAAVDYEAEFDRVFKAYCRYCLGIDWPATFPELALLQVFSIMRLFTTTVIK